MNNRCNRENILFIGLIILLPLILFWKYIVGAEYFVFRDIASDRLYQIYPNLINVANRISGGEWESGITFYNGLGGFENALTLNLSNWICCFGRDRVAYLMGINVVLKMIISGIIIYRWLGLVGLNGISKMILTLGYEFNSMYTVRSSWSIYPNIALLVALNLYLLERVIKKRDKLSFVFLISSLLISYFELGTYYSVLFGGLFILYLFARLYLHGGNRLKIRYCIIGITVFISLIAVVASGEITKALSSERFTNGREKWISSLSSWYIQKPFFLIEAFKRSIGNTLGGIYLDFNGAADFLSGPTLYIGILTLMLIPTAIYNLEKRKKILCLFFVFLSYIYLCFPFFNSIANGFSYSELTYKMSSFWIPVGWILTDVLLLKELEKDNLKSNSISVFNITSIIFLLLLLFLHIHGDISRNKDWVLSIAFVILYTLIINVWLRGIKKIKWLLLAAVCCECVLVSWNTINDRDSMTSDEINELYENGAKYVLERDQDWYRIDSYPDGSAFCKSLVGNYYGTQAYTGGTGLPKDVLSFCRTLGLPEASGKYEMGCYGDIYASSLLGVKYQLQNGIQNYEYGFKKRKEITGADVYVNEYALPLAYVYDKQIEEQEFEDMSILERNRAIIQGAVIENDVLGVEKVSLDDYIIPQYKRMKKIDLNYTGGIIDLESLYLSNDELCLIHFNTNGDEEIPEFYSTHIVDVNNNENYIFCELNSPLEIYSNSLKTIWFDGWLLSFIKDIDVYVYDEQYYCKYREQIEKLKRNGLQLQYFDRHMIYGRINTDYSGIIASTIPWSTQMNIFIDGVEVNKYKVNKCFIGTSIEEGKHLVSFEYPRKKWIFDAWKWLISYSSFIMILIVSIVQRCMLIKRYQ